MIHLQSKGWQRFAVAGVALTLALTLAACGNKATGMKSAHTDNHQIKVIASVDFYGEVAQKVLGNAGTVTSVISSPDIDPHEYQPTTKVAAEVANANVLLSNGIGYDTWMQKLAQDNTKATNIQVGEDILNKHNGDNPHLWYQLKTMPALANYLAAKFAKMDPEKASYFKVNAQKYIATLQPLTTIVNQLKQNSNGKLVDVSEPVFDYALEEMGYRENNQSFAESVENSTDPSPKSVAAMQQDVVDGKIAFFVQNTQASDKTVLRLVKLAKQHHVPVVQVTETKPTGKNYEQWMLSQFKEVQAIQNGKTN